MLSAASDAIADPDLHGLVGEAIDGTDRAFGRLFAEARAAGELPQDADPRRLARMASATLHTLSIRARARIPRAEILPIIDDAVTTICGEERVRAPPASPFSAGLRFEDGVCRLTSIPTSWYVAGTIEPAEP